MVPVVEEDDDQAVAFRVPATTSLVAHIFSLLTPCLSLILLRIIFSLSALERDTDADGARKDRLRMLNFTLPADPAVCLELATGSFQLIELLREVKAQLPPSSGVMQQ
ncbi:hypothetical protein B0H14DRAFT_3492160 [Mycena olivaceomarginata]|nr:hypothetical protein B0H14DRAFT_3492160 [Mycena olivaceomarginata]